MRTTILLATFAVAGATILARWLLFFSNARSPGVTSMRSIWIGAKGKTQQKIEKENRQRRTGRLGRVFERDS